MGTVTIAIVRWHDDGTCHTQTWPIDEDMATWLTEQLGTPHVEKLLSADITRRAHDLARESPSLIGGNS